MCVKHPSAVPRTDTGVLDHFRAHGGMHRTRDVLDLLVQTRERLVGFDEVTGEELWSQKIKAFRGMNILTTVVVSDTSVPSGYGGKALLFDLTQSGNGTNKKMTVTKRWLNKTQGYMSTLVVIDGHIDTNLKNQCYAGIELATGKERWVTTPFGKYWSLVAQGQKIRALDKRGDLLLINANPDKFELLRQCHVSDSPAWAHRAVCGNGVFIRDLNGLTVQRWGRKTDAGVGAK